MKQSVSEQEHLSEHSTYLTGELDRYGWMSGEGVGGVGGGGVGRCGVDGTGGVGVEWIGMEQWMWV